MSTSVNRVAPLGAVLETDRMGNDRRPEISEGAQDSGVGGQESLLRLPSGRTPDIIKVRRFIVCPETLAGDGERPMLTIRCILFTGMLALAAAQTHAASVLFTFQSQFPNTDWHLAWRDGAANIVTLDASDTDGDGMASAIGNLDLTTPRVDLFGMPMMDDPILLSAHGESGNNPLVPLFHTLAGAPLVAETGGQLLGTFTIGQVVNVVNGLVVDFSGSVRVDPGITSATALLNTDILALPAYNGQARVVALFSAAVVPEPATLVLLIIGIATICCRRLLCVS